MTKPSTKVFDEPRFLQLHEQDQHLLELMAVIYSAAPGTPIAQAATAVGITHVSSLKYTFKLIKPVLEELAGQGWVLIDNTHKTAIRYQCPPHLRDVLTQRAMKAGRFENLVSAINQFFRTSPEARSWSQPNEALRDIRNCVLLGDTRNAIGMVNTYGKTYHAAHPWIELWGDPVHENWFPYIPEPILNEWILPSHLYLLFQQLDSNGAVWEQSDQYLQTQPGSQIWNNFGSDIYWQYFARGQWDLPHLLPPDDDSMHNAYWHPFQAAQHVYRGEHVEAIKVYKKGLAKKRKHFKAQRGHRVWFRNDFEIFQVLLQLLSGDAKQINAGLKQAQELTYVDNSYPVLEQYGQAIKAGKKEDLHDPSLLVNQPLAILFSLCTHFWLGKKISADILETMDAHQQKATQAGFEWLAGEYAAVLAELLPAKDSRRATHTATAKTIQKKLGIQTFLIGMNRPKQEWEHSLEALLRLGQSKGKSRKASASASGNSERLVWFISKHTSSWSDHTAYAIYPRLQKRTKKGGWTAGRNVALKHLFGAPDDLAYVDEDDRRVCRSVDMNVEYNYGGYGNKVYDINEDKAWPALVGHPRVFWADAPNTPLDIQMGKAELLTERKAGKMQISLHPSLKDKTDYRTNSHLIVEETTVQLRAYPLSKDVLQLHDVLGAEGLTVPLEAEALLRQTLETLAPMITIQSDIQVGEESSAEDVEADQCLQVHMLPWGDGLRMMLRVQPFGERGGPVFAPGIGRSNVMAEVDGVLLKTNRPLKQEQKRLRQLRQDCQALADWDDPEEDLLLEEPEDCLETLEQLHNLGDEVTLLWPEGEKMRINATVSSDHLSLRIGSQGEWFHLDGSVQVDADTVLSLRQLLELNQQSTGRFVPLGDGQFLSLTRQFQKKLDALHAYAEKDGKKGIKIGALAGLAMDELLSEAGEVKADKQWQSQLKRLRSIRDSQPQVPTDLQTELRDYQLEGFQWMMRLAEWGVGACLADDMGLGKTIQTLAVLLTRIKKGAALVVAPLSVCNNWFSECQRFAPGLRPIFYRGKGRETLLESLQPGDLLICSYGLMQQDAKVLQQVHWGSIVLDEAQAIKNTQAKRTRAAYQLQGDFRLITTGTPIENHLGELWSLFRFLNPGLLFSQQQFAERFVTPIERDNEPLARQHLKRLVQPFILRRSKNQVLQELPPRTEITLQVQLGEGERALYEAMRQQAIEQLEQDQQEGKEAGHLEVLAQITRLRLASCHPQLVMPESELPSAKMQALTELVSELLENRHKALIFSQFVKHLALAKEWLDEQGIAYHYLDGSTSQKQRQKSVDAFQRGERDIFLISLKAGGSGLNLTAADYVIHLDPWWNPAVEDQASDRAHRIGQQRPVTIYRLVAENTIEEKIVRLHQRKRDLADSLLEGSDMSGKLSAQEMMAMIREEAK